MSSCAIVKRKSVAKSSVEISACFIEFLNRRTGQRLADWPLLGRHTSLSDRKCA